MMDQLTADGELTRGGLYHHFDSKRGLMEAVVEQIDTEMVARLRNDLKRATAGRQALPDEGVAYLRLALEPQFQRIVLLDGPAVSGPPMYWPSPNTCFAGTIERIQQGTVRQSARVIGMRSYRRTAILIDPPAGENVANWPMVCDVDEAFYLTPDAGMLLLSPADEEDSEPGDAQPRDLDIAIAVDTVERVTTLKVKRIVHRWAGLSSFVPDRSPIVRCDGNVSNFFWVAALGGYGIQTAPEHSRLAAAPARPIKPGVTGFDLQHLSPARNFDRALTRPEAQTIDDDGSRRFWRFAMIGEIT